MPTGKHTPERPAGPGADHAANFNRALRDALESWRDQEGTYRLEFSVTINPGSVKDYRIDLSPR